MLRRSTVSHGNTLRNRKKYPYLVSHNKLPWNTVEPGSVTAHKLLAPCFVRVFETALTNRAPAVGAANQLVRTEHPALAPEEWIFRLPSTTYIVAETAEDSAIPLEMVAPFEGWGNGAAAAQQEHEVAQQQQPESDDGCGKKVTDSMCLVHYGPLQSRVGQVESVAEFRSPDLRIVGNAVRIMAPLRIKAAPLSGMWQLHKKHDGTEFKSFSLFHYYRPNRAPSELEAAFDKFAPRQRPDLSALREAVPATTANKAASSRSGGKIQVASPMPVGPVPTSPMYGLFEREAIRPGDTFGCRSRMWGTTW